MLRLCRCGNHDFHGHLHLRGWIKTAWVSKTFLSEKVPNFLSIVNIICYSADMKILPIKPCFANVHRMCTVSELFGQLTNRLAFWCRLGFHCSCGFSCGCLICDGKE